VSKAKLSAVIGVAILACVVACVLLLISSHASYSSPEKSIAAFIDAESQADLAAMEKPASKALYLNFVGRFGQSKFRDVRNIYQNSTARRLVPLPGRNIRASPRRSAS
jgi:hypothetical protein